MCTLNTYYTIIFVVLVNTQCKLRVTVIFVGRRLIARDRAAAILHGMAALRFTCKCDKPVRE